MQFSRSVATACCLALAAMSASPPAEAGSTDAVIAGAAGFTIGTLLGSSTARPRYYPGTVYIAPPPPPPVIYQPAPVVYYAPAPWTPEWYAYCARKFDSFDPRSGTYEGYDGYRHMCR
jgi:hypothetical protein